MVFSISEFQANIYTFITHGPAQASNIHTPPSSHMVSPPRFYFFNLEPALCTSIIPVHKPYFFLYMVVNANITFETNLSILSNTIAKFISCNHHARKTSTTLARFLHILQLFWQKRIIYSGCSVPTSFSCLFLVQEFCVDAPWLRALYNKVSALPRVPIS